MPAMPHPSLPQKSADGLLPPTQKSYLNQHHDLESSTMNQEEQASRLKAIIDTAIDGIITIDEGGIIETVNPAAATLFEYDIQELIGQNISILMPEPDRSRHDQYISAYLQSGHAKIIGIGREVKGQKKNGEVFPFRLAISEVNMTSGPRIFTGIIHDLTKQKEDELRLLKYAKELERSNRELEEFAYVSSHDLQEPLRKIQAFGSRIEEMEAKHLTPKGQDYLSRMLSASMRMQGLINDLLSFSRVSAKSKAFKSLDLNEVMNGVISDLEILIQETNAQITVKPLPAIEADPTQMRQLFQNLISNAIKFRGEAPPQILIDLQEQAGSEKDEVVTIAFADNGIGFDEKYLDRIFQIFQRLEGRKFDGSGIGLAICRRIADRHGGTITATSSPGQGATFYVTLQKRHPENRTI